MDESTDAILKDCSHQSLEHRGCVTVTHLHYLASEHAKYCGECCLMDVFRVKPSRSPSNCQDSVQSLIDPLPPLWLRSNHPPILRHYTNQNPKLQVPPNPPAHFLSLSKLWTTSENPNHISVFICLHHSVLVLLNSKSVFMSLSQFSPFHFQYIKPFQYSHSLVLVSTLPLYISASLLLISLNSL